MKTVFKSPWGIFGFGALIAVLIWSTYGVVGYILIRNGMKPDVWGQFGDGFGVINCLFTALAFVAVAVAFYHERQANADREREHQAILNKMSANNKAMVHLARITAFSALMTNYRDDAERIRVNGVSVASGSGKQAADRKSELAEKIRTYETVLEKLAQTSEIL